MILKLFPEGTIMSLTSLLGTMLTVAFGSACHCRVSITGASESWNGRQFRGPSETGISVTGVASITGDIGISPAAATYMTGFGLIMDASGAFSTSSLVTGKVYAATISTQVRLK